jgi:hypothetical protein
MSKPVKFASAKKSAIAQSETPGAGLKPEATTVPTANLLQTATEDAGRRRHPASKQSRVITMLQSSGGTTIAAMMKATGWRQHSVRGFLAGVVRKRLKLKLSSKKLDGERVYSIASANSRKAGARPSKRQPS